MDEPFANHNGGWIGFKGSYLYIATGDGGGGGDPGNRAQNLNKLLGKILRINPLDPDGSGPKHYSIPADNPFVGVAGKDAIWSYGLRNPWRCSFDDLDGTLFCGDVGQDEYEEIDRVATGRGVNFGWRLLEGIPLLQLARPHQRRPVHRRLQDAAHRRVRPWRLRRRQLRRHRRLRVAPLGRGAGRRLRLRRLLLGQGVGHPGQLHRRRHAAGTRRDTSYNISSFGEGNDGKLYLVDLNGSIYRLTDS